MCSLSTSFVQEAEYTYNKIPSHFANMHVLLLALAQFN